MHFQTISFLNMSKNVVRDVSICNFPHIPQYGWLASSPPHCISVHFLKMGTALVFPQALGTWLSLLPLKDDRAYLKTHVVAFELPRLQSVEWLHFRTIALKIMVHAAKCFGNFCTCCLSDNFFPNLKFVNHANICTTSIIFPKFNSYTSRTWNLNSQIKWLHWWKWIQRELSKDRNEKQNRTRWCKSHSMKLNVTENILKHFARSMRVDSKQKWEYLPAQDKAFSICTNPTICLSFILKNEYIYSISIMNTCI